jgi:choline dehydrogenase-like flavoprotein
MENISSAPPRQKTDPEEYDLVVLGSGAGSKLAAWTLAHQGKRVAVIERKYIGGIVPEHRLSAEQEHRSQCEGCLVLSQA